MIAAVAQSFAFSYEPFVNVTLGKTNVLQSIGDVISVNDVITDAQNTFLDDPSDQANNEINLDSNQSNQIGRLNQEFNWNEIDEREAVKKKRQNTAKTIF